MTYYSVVFEVLASTVVRVKAASPEEAKDKAERYADPPSICNCCGKDIQIDGIGKILEVYEE